MTPGGVVRAVRSLVRDRLSSRAESGAPDTLMRLAPRRRWPHGVPQQEFLQALHDELEPRPRARVVLVGGRSVPVLAKLMRSLYPELVLVVLDAATDASDLHVALSVTNPYHLIVDLADSDAAAQVDLFERCFWHLGRQAAYLVRRVRPTDGLDLAAVLELAAHTVWVREAPQNVRDLAALGRSLGEVRLLGESLLVRNAVRVRPKLREAEVDRVLEARPELGSVVSTRPGSTMASRCDYAESPQSVEHDPAEGFFDPFQLPVFEAPPLRLRVYRQPTCGRGQIVESQGLLLPDTFRHHLYPRLVNTYINDTALLFGEVRTPLGNPLPLEGAYFHFDSEYSGHFGHTLTEQISRLWAYREARELEPDLKLLTTLPKSRTDQRLQEWELALLEPYGVGVEDVVVFDRSVKPDRLYAATPMFSHPSYVHQEIEDTWDFLARSLVAQARDVPRPSRIFCSRRTSLKRACRNTPEVEALFRDHGFAIVYPEDHPLAEQVAMFRQADVIGGFAGSALFTTAFCDVPKTVIMIGPDSYTPRNEYMFASVRGHRLRAVWSRPDIAHPDGGWTHEAFSSSYAVDFEREGTFLLDVLQQLPS